MGEVSCYAEEIGIDFHTQSINDHFNSKTILTNQNSKFLLFPFDNFNLFNQFTLVFYIFLSCFKNVNGI